MALVPSVSLCILLMMKCAYTNKTELYIGVQTSDPFNSEVLEVWSRLIVSYINQMEMVQNYTLVPHFLKELLPDTSKSYRGQLLLDLTDYLSTNRAYCYIGNLDSDHTLVTADVTAEKHILQISPLSIAPALSNKTRYPYFLRIQSPSSTKVQMLMQILVKYNWKRFAVIFENQEPFISYYNNLLDYFSKMNRSAELTATYTSDPTNVIQRLKTSGLKIFISISYMTTVPKVMCEAKRAGITGKRYVWIIDHLLLEYGSWWDVPTPLALNCSAEEWATTLENQFEAVLDASVRYNQQTILNKTFNDIKEEMAVYFPSGFMVWDDLIAQVADGLLACALALNHTKEKIVPDKLEDISCETGEDLAVRLFSACIGLQFRGFSGNVSFSSTGDAQRIYLVYQVKNGSHGKPVMAYIEADNKMEYFKSDRDLWKHNGGTPLLDEDIIITTAISIPESLFYIYIGLAALSVILAIILITAQLIFRKRSTVKYSWPYLNAVIAVGCIVISIVVVLKGLDPNRLDKEKILTTCKATNWLLAMGFTLTVGAMLSKLWAIYKYFNTKAKGKKNNRECGSMFIIVTMLVIDVVIMIVWSLADPLVVRENILDGTTDFEKQTVYKEFTYTCTSENATYWIIAFLCYKGIVLILAGFLTWPAWMISARHRVNDSHYLGIAVYICILSSAIAVPVSFLLQGDPVLQYGLVGGFMQGSILLTISLIMIPKLAAICADTDERISKVNSPIGALFGFMSVLADSGALPGAGIEKAKQMFAVNIATSMVDDKRKLED